MKKAVLGINLSHDTSACLIYDGPLLAAEEERWSGLKHNCADLSPQILFPTNAIKFLFDETGISFDNLLGIWAVSRSRQHIYDYGKTGFDIPLPRELKNKKIEFITHHKAHILSGYYTSPFEECVGLCIDGNGSFLGLDLNHRETITAYYLSNESFKRIYHLTPNYSFNGKNGIQSYKNSLGHFYYNFAQRCIPAGDEPEGSLMALSAFGDSTVYYNEVRRLIDFHPNGLIQIHPPYGDGLKENDIISIRKTEFSVQDCIRIPIESRAHLASAVQRVFEEAVLHILDHLQHVTQSASVILTGGCALNSKLNGSIAKRSNFSDVYIPLAPHDAGTAIGAAMYGWCNHHGFSKPEQRQGCGYGPNIQNIDAADERIFQNGDFRVIKYQQKDDLVQTTAELLATGKIIGWARGRMEFGPRALGQRCVLANPTSKNVKKRLNQIKQRAEYRPFAVSILENEFFNWFEGEEDQYMNKIAYAVNSEPIKEILHFDQSVRVQVVSPKHHDFYDLINRFFSMTGIPMVVNTSLNLKGKPIIKDKTQAIQALLELSVDGFVIANTLILKQ